MKHNRRSGKLPQPTRKRRPTTINDLLTRDDVNGIIKELSEVKPNITAVIVIYLDGDNRYHWQVTWDTLSSIAVWMLESTKLDLLNEDMD